MPESGLVGLASVVVLGISAQWLAARLRLPSILLLLAFGFVAGPLAGWLNPDHLFGDLLFPLVSLSVALILYEGGLTLRFSELTRGGRVVRNLCSIGAAVTWVVAAAAAHLIFGLDLGVATLIGAVLVVTGPTVIGPLLRHIRPTGAVGPVLNWEGIVIDPIGAILAVLVFESLAGAGPGATALTITLAIFKTIIFGGGLGLLAAGLLTYVLHRYWIPDTLHSAVSLMLVVAAFTVANEFQHESGLLAVTVMGMVLANQRYADVRHIVEFKENLRVLLISALFILLAARLDLADLARVGWRGPLFVAVLIFIARPLAVYFSSLGSGLTRPERRFLAWMAPRGIVAAAVASIFEFRLKDIGYADADLLVPITFMTIIGTVAVYGLTSPYVARRLGVAVPDPQGLLLIGAQPWVRALGVILQKKGFTVLLVDSNRENTAAARMEGLPVYSGSILAEHTIREMSLGGIGRLLAVTANDWVNALAVQRFARIFGTAACYQLPPRDEPRGKQTRHKHLHGRWAFGEVNTYADLAQRSAAGYTVKATKLSESFNYAAFRKLYGETAVPLVLITESGRLEVIAADRASEPRPGQTLLSLVDPQRDPPKHEKPDAGPAAGTE